MLVGRSLGAGIFGHHYIAGMNWVDSMAQCIDDPGRHGQVGPLTTNLVKLFGFTYALFRGLVANTVMGTVLSPLVHRALHLFHLDEDGGK